MKHRTFVFVLSIKSGLKAQFLHSPGQRPGYIAFNYNNAPCKGNYMWHNRVALTGRIIRKYLIPRALPWAMEILGFQPALYEFLHTLLLLIPNKSKKCFAKKK